MVFPVVRFSKKSPEETGNDIGSYLQQHVAEVVGFNVVKGFLNLSIAESYWVNLFNDTLLASDFLVAKPNGQKVMVEYSSPNTNKPLHLGHVRNNLLGYSVSELLKADGYEVIKTNLVNDRGIHICKSMLAWQKWGNGETPESTGLKGDKLVGNYILSGTLMPNIVIPTLITSAVILQIFNRCCFTSASSSLIIGGTSW